MPRSEAHARLGRALRTTRTRAGISTRGIPKDDSSHYSSGHVSSVESGDTPPSAELIDAYADMPGSVPAELRSLYEQMLAASREAGRRRRGTGTAPAPPRDLTGVRDWRDVQRHYVSVSIRADYRFGAGGEVREVVCAVALRARTLGVRLFHTGFSYPADQRPGVLGIEPVSGAEVESLYESATGAVGSYLRLDRELSPQDPGLHTVTYRVTVRSEARAAPRLRYFAPDGSEQLFLRASYPDTARPGGLWWFAAPNVVEAEHPVPGRDLAPAGVYEHLFDGLVPGWCYGFAWTW